MGGFLGTPAFAVPYAGAGGRPGIRAGGVHAAGPPEGRGQREAMSPVKEAALRLGLPVLSAGARAAA